GGGIRSRRFFFFQAEDGIRDWSVTGVQTCALPISQARAARRDTAFRYTVLSPSLPPGQGGPPIVDIDRYAALRGEYAPAPTDQRSEERRVGKEGATRGGAEPVKQRGRRGTAR